MEFEIVIDEESIKEGLRPVIEALVLVLKDREMNEFLDKDKIVESALNQIVSVLKKSEAIQIR